MWFRFVSGAAALLAGLALAQSASAADYSRSGYREKVVKVRGVDAAVDRDFALVLPTCNDPQVERRVAHAFSHRERSYWASDLELSPFHRPAEIGYRSWGAEFVPRRFCSARTVTSDGRKRQVNYVISQGFGFVGLSWGVEWCVTGLDRSYAYAPHCKMARP